MFSINCAQLYMHRASDCLSCHLTAVPSGTASALSCSPATASTLTAIPENEDNDLVSPALQPTFTHIVAPTTAPHHPQIESDSSSDFKYPIASTNRYSFTMLFIPNQLAIVEHIHQSKSPVLLAGKIDLAIMHMVELGCLHSFDCKEIKEGPGLKNPWMLQRYPNL